MTIEDLYKYRNIVKNIHDIVERLLELDATLLSASKLTVVKVDNSHKTSEIDKYLEIKTKLEEKLIRELISSLTEQFKIEQFVDDISDLEIKLIVRKRFIDGKKWEEIGQELNTEMTTPRKKIKRYLESLEVKNESSIGRKY